MELDSTTFVLEIINFLVLVWLLNRFLYRPVQAAIAARSKREEALAGELAQQRAALQNQASELARQQAELTMQRAKSEAALAQEMAAMKQQRMQALQADLQAEREKARARLEQERDHLLAQSEQEMHLRMARFGALYLKRLATPAVEQAIIGLFLSDMQQQSEAVRQALRAGWLATSGDAPTIDISTAYPPGTALRDRVQAQIETLLGQAAHIQWREDATLLSGICAHLPGHQLEASLRQGVDAFARMPLSKMSAP